MPEVIGVTLEQAIWQGNAIAIGHVDAGDAGGIAEVGAGLAEGRHVHLEEKAVESRGEVCRIANGIALVQDFAAIGAIRVPIPYQTGVIMGDAIAVLIDGCGMRVDAAAPDGEIVGTVAAK